MAEFFSVITDNYTQLDGENFVDVSNTIDFSITNHSGYNNTYKYSFTDLSDEGSYLFNNEDAIHLDPWDPMGALAR